MMEQGMPTDISTLRPKTAADKAKEARVKEAAMLRHQASHIGISETRQGRQLLALVHDNMITRLLELAQNDAACLAYMDMLDAIGSSENLARMAVKRMFEHQQLQIPKKTT